MPEDPVKRSSQPVPLSMRWSRLEKTMSTKINAWNERSSAEAAGAFMPDLSDNIRHAQQDRDRSEADLAFESRVCTGGGTSQQAGATVVDDLP